MATFKAWAAGLLQRIEARLEATAKDWEQRDMIEARKRINASLKLAEEEKKRRTRAAGRYR